MSDIRSYEDYLIFAAPYQLADNQKWTVNIHISPKDDTGLRMRNFFAGNTFETREEAVQNCFEFGRQIIDGEVKNCTVDDFY